MSERGSEKMNARFYKAWEQLRKQDREIIEKVKTQEALEIANHESAEVQKIMLKSFCIVMNKNQKYGRKRLLLVLGCWKEMYRIIGKIKTREELNEYLDSEMDRIFGVGGYPYEFIDKLEEL